MSEARSGREWHSQSQFGVDGTTAKGPGGARQECVQGYTGAVIRNVIFVALCSGMLLSPAWSQDWPQLLGPNRDGVYPDEAFVPGEPRMLWSKDVGQGFAGPVVASNKLLLFHRVGGAERVDALNASTGEPIWSSESDTSYRDDFGFDEGPRAAPVVSGDRVYTFGAQGVLTARALDSGKELWQVDTRARFGAPKGWFGSASSPLVTGEHVVANVGGPDGAGIVAFDIASGEPVWSATDHEASYSSPSLDAGRALFLTREGLVILNPADGSIFYEKRWKSRSRASVNAATPLVIGDVVFVSASYGTGAVALDFSAPAPVELWSSDDVLSGHYATAVHLDGVLYGYHGRQEFGQSLRAVDLKTGKVHWSEDRFLAGSVTRVGHQLLLMRESGELVIAEATPQAFRAISNHQLLPGVVRAYPSLSDGRMCVRNVGTLACFDLSSD